MERVDYPMCRFPTPSAPPASLEDLARPMRVYPFVGPDREGISRQLDGVMDRADKVTAEILGATATSRLAEERRDHPVMRHYHYHYSDCGWGWWFWGGPRVTVVNHYHRSAEAEREDRRNAWLVLAGVAFVALSVVSAYFVGRDIGVLGDTDTVLEDASRDGQTVHQLRSHGLYHLGLDAKADEVGHIVDGEERLLRRIKRETVFGLALKVSLLAAGVMGATAAIFGALEVVAVAAAVALVVSCALLIKAGVASSSHNVEGEARRLQEEIFRVRRAY